MPEKTAEIRGRDTQFKPGNPGRPKGSRNKLGESFLTDVLEIWKTDGPDVLREARAEKPMEFAKMVAGLIPGEMTHRHEVVGDMTEAEIDERLDALERFIADTRFSAGAAKATHETEGRA